MPAAGLVDHWRAVGASAAVLIVLNGADTSATTLSRGASVRLTTSQASSRPGDGFGSNFGEAVSADGRFVAFRSAASDLVSGDTNAADDVFMRDRVARLTHRISLGAGVRQANSFSDSPAISSYGRYVAFHSAASNLVAGDVNATFDVFVRDVGSGVTARVSVGAAGQEGNGPSDSPAISADGRFIAFRSAASNLVTGDTNGVEDVFLRDRATGATQRVSVGAAGQEAHSPSDSPAISGDGRFVTFHPAAANLAPGDTNITSDVFRRDRLTGATLLVSVGASGQAGNSFSDSPAISADGRFVTFRSAASNLVVGDTNGVDDIFVHDALTGATQRISVGSDGRQADGFSITPAISADGRFVAFDSDSTDLVPGDRNFAFDVFLKDRLTGMTRRLSVGPAGEEANSFSDSPAISADGRFVGFHSTASNLATTHGVDDFFGQDRLTGLTLVSAVGQGAEGAPAAVAALAPCAGDDHLLASFGAGNLVVRKGNRLDDNVFADDVGDCARSVTTLDRFGPYRRQAGSAMSDPARREISP